MMKNLCNRISRYWLGEPRVVCIEDKLREPYLHDILMLVDAMRMCRTQVAAKRIRGALISTAEHLDKPVKGRKVSGEDLLPDYYVGMFSADQSKVRFVPETTFGKVPSGAASRAKFSGGIVDEVPPSTVPVYPCTPECRPGDLKCSDCPGKGARWVVSPQYADYFDSLPEDQKPEWLRKPRWSHPDLDPAILRARQVVAGEPDNEPVHIEIVAKVAGIASASGGDGVSGD